MGKRRQQISSADKEARATKNRKQLDFEERLESVLAVQGAYDHLEKRELTGKEIDALPPHMLGGIYRSEMIDAFSHTVAVDDDEEHGLDFEDAQRDEHNNRKFLKLPTDGGIFRDGIPFHHFALTPLEEKHINRLRRNGVEICHRKFSKAEDAQLRANWRSLAKEHDLPEEEAPLYMSAATSTEGAADHQERIRFIKESRFRPWMCKRLLNRTCAQVFRRCYILFQEGADDELAKPWTADEDDCLLALAKENGREWQKIGGELKRTRYSCRKRYLKITGEQEGDDDTAAAEEPVADTREWSNKEVARLYGFLCKEMDTHPILVANFNRYQQCEEGVDWASPRLKLPAKTPKQRKKKWRQLKKAFRKAKRALGTDLLSDVEQAVFPPQLFPVKRRLGA